MFHPRTQRSDYNIFRKVVLICMVLFLSVPQLKAQELDAFGALPFVEFPDTAFLRPEFEFSVISIAEFNRMRDRQAASVVEDTSVVPDGEGLFLVHTQNASYALRQTNAYEGSYQYVGLVPELRAHFISFCGEGMCEDFLLDTVSDTKMLLPAGFDAGLLGFQLSPGADYLLIYSSYDGPDYENYYYFRSTFSVYHIAKGKGLAGLEADIRFETGDWSIEEMVWMDDRSLGLKVYRGNRTGAGIEGGFEYYRIGLQN